MESTFPVFDPVSPQAESIRDLFVQVLVISAGIFMIVAGLICIALWRFRAREELPEQEFGSHKREIAWLVGPVIIVLWIGAVSAKLILTLNAAPPLYASPAARPGETSGNAADVNGTHGDSDNARRADVDLIVVGHQWWWEVRYPQTGIRSSGEVHIPTGKKLRVKLQSDDVIHSFWTPQLARKIDAVPGHDNYLWLEASKPGVYQGRCAEYCGTQHAWMNFRVVAHAPEEFEQWKTSESAAPPPPAAGPAIAGQRLFLTLTCSQCHTIAGTEAQARYAPDLTHLASRGQLGSGVVENTPQNLRAWLRDPQALKPGCKMPNFKLDAEQLDQLVAYLETLE